MCELEWKLAVIPATTRYCKRINETRHLMCPLQAWHSCPVPAYWWNGNPLTVCAACERDAHAFGEHEPLPEPLLGGVHACVLVYLIEHPPQVRAGAFLNV